ncbi:MAG: hypothetical protein NUW24_11840, partial [Anaerolineae bacterium]|nr:hypothetical protein [Anaerolineae bacterium]
PRYPDDPNAVSHTPPLVSLYLEKCRPPEGHQVILAEVGQIGLNGQPNPELGVVTTTFRERSAS